MERGKIARRSVSSSISSAHRSSGPRAIEFSEFEGILNATPLRSPRLCTLRQTRLHRQSPLRDGVELGAETRRSVGSGRGKKLERGPDSQAGELSARGTARSGSQRVTIRVRSTRRGIGFRILLPEEQQRIRSRLRLGVHSAPPEQRPALVPVQRGPLLLFFPRLFVSPLVHFLHISAPVARARPAIASRLSTERAGDSAAHDQCNRLRSECLYEQRPQRLVLRDAKLLPPPSSCDHSDPSVSSSTAFRQSANVSRSAVLLFPIPDRIRLVTRRRRSEFRAIGVDEFSVGVAAPESLYRLLRLAARTARAQVFAIANSCSRIVSPNSCTFDCDES